MIDLAGTKAYLTMLFALTGLALILPDALTPAQEPRLDPRKSTRQLSGKA